MSLPLRFGISVTPTAADYPSILEQVAAAERDGLDLIGIQDHPYQRRFLDTFSLIADLLARTSRIRIFPDVASLPMRHPAMLAKAAGSLDTMSGGRFELGLGAGAFWDAVSGMGGPRRPLADRFSALEEAVGIVRAALDAGSERGVVRSSGPHYPIPGYPPGPPAAHRVEIWIGAMAPRSLALIGRKADGWIPGAGTAHVDRFPELTARIDAAAEEAGRDPSRIRRILNLSGPVAGDRGERLVDWATRLGIDSFIYWPPDTDPIHVARFAQDIVPAVRERVGRPT